MFFYQKIWPDVPPDFHNPSSFQLPINQEAVKPKEFVRSRCIISEVKWCEYGLWSQLLVFDKCVPNFYDAATDFLQKAAANTEQSWGPGSNICKCDTYGCFEGDLWKTSSRVCGDKKTDMFDGKSDHLQLCSWRRNWVLLTRSQDISSCVCSNKIRCLLFFYKTTGHFEPCWQWQKQDSLARSQAISINIYI